MEFELVAKLGPVAMLGSVAKPRRIPSCECRLKFGPGAKLLKET